VKSKADNSMEIIFDAKSENESFARVATAAFITRLDPTVEEIADIKTAVSEAVTNCIVHGYDGCDGKITLKCSIEDEVVTIEIHDDGVGIENIGQALQPLYTSKPEQERSGMGFSFMEAFMDELQVISGKTGGTTVIMKKKIGA
jgi:stage II sporulation protein AB (anti-sigma F factor)